MRSLSCGILALFVSACSGPAGAVQCEQNANCNLSAGGMCVEANGHQWCAYPDPGCPAGYRYSDQSVGDGLAGQCIDDGPPVDARIDAPPDMAIDGPPVVPGSWGKQIPGAGFESVGAVAIASDGSVYFAGSYNGTLDIGGGPLVASGTLDVFVAKFSSAGQHVWSVRFGGSSNADATELAVLSNGEIAVGGWYRGSLNFGGTTLNSVGDKDVFVARLNTTGGVVWARSGGTTGTEVLGDLAVDASDNIALCGGMVTGGGAPLTGSFFGVNLTGSTDAWVVRLTGAGASSWGRTPAASGSNSNCGVAAVGADVVVVGNFNGTANAGGSTFTSTANSLDMYIARLQGADGAHVWSTSKGGTGNDEALDVDSSGGSIIVSGYFGASISFGGNTLTSAGSDDGFVVKLDSTNGAHQWSVRFGGNTGESAKHLSTRSDGQVSASGIFTGTVSFGGTSLTSNGDYDPFVIDLDGSNGAITSVKSVGGVSRDEAHDVASSADSLVFAGSFASSITVLNQTYTSMGGLDGYVIRFKR